MYVEYLFILMDKITLMSLLLKCYDDCA